MIRLGNAPETDGSQFEFVSDFAAIGISAFALAVSILSLVYVLSARPKLRVRVTPIHRNARYIGDIVDLFNAGRKSMVITDIGALGDGGEIYIPQEAFDESFRLPESARIPVVIGAGEAVSVHFTSKGPEMETARRKNGYRVTILGRRWLWRPSGLKRRVFLPREDGDTWF